MVVFVCASITDGILSFVVQTLDRNWHLEASANLAQSLIQKSTYFLST